MIKIGFLGPEGTFSEKAARDWLKKIKHTLCQIEGKTGIPQLFRELEAGKLDQIVVPVENSIEGAVNLTQDYLIRLNRITILGEINLNIEHCLVTKGEISFSQVKAVYSHPQALSQCHEYLQRNLKQAALYQTSSTAEAAKTVVHHPPGIAAITSLEAARKYNLNVLAQKIQDFADNKTRFWVLKKNASGFDNTFDERDYSFKTSIVVALPYNRPGSLYEILKEFADANLDLTRIESRPTKKELGEYLFIIDFRGSQRHRNVVETLKKLRKKSAMLKILGSYPVII